ncbi:hypothetical protein [Lentibacillus saliphilus]|uniref:hypothetical protein n=1 Tax=Lentibacillus saliphilus TaxID=2737028 RepID=UPI001C30F27A|nr:hypothetical protein [Lentibacillus saliphilus]
MAYSTDASSSLRLDGEAKTISIVSNNCCYGPYYLMEIEIEQHLTITDDGQVSFTGFKLGNGLDEYECTRTKQCSLDQQSTDRIFSAFTRFFSDEFVEMFATDIGTWELTITNTTGQDFVFRGPLCEDYEIDGIDLSDMVRDALGIENLFVFDGNNKPDQVERISVDYYKTTNIKPYALINELEDDRVTWDYSEHVVIDRETETIEHIQQIDSGCVVSQQYRVEGRVSEFLDDLDAECLFEDIKGSSLGAEDPNEKRTYIITLDFKNNPQRVIEGSFDKNGLPEDWSEFAEDLSNFLSAYKHGDIFNRSIYSKAKRQANEYMFCSVVFHYGDKRYYYIADDDTIKVGDFVLVPAGMDNHIAKVQVVDIEYVSKEDAPLDVDQTKHIIRRCNENDCDPA